MLDLFRSVCGGLLFVVSTLTPGPPDPRRLPDLHGLGQPRTAVVRRQDAGEASARAGQFVRTELYFGSATPEGELTEEQFREFLDQQVTPRFPGGLTVVRADGQFTNGHGHMVKERSFMIVLLYPYKDLAEGHRRIERIRALYKSRFGQESVLRVDHPFIVWVSY